MNTDTPTSQSDTPPPRKRRKVWFRLAAVGFGLFLLILIEAACWLFGWGTPSHAEDPYVGFREIHPLFEPDPTGENYVIPPARLNFFAPESFPINKGENTFRIFCLGGSTVQGRPWSKETSFPTFLKLALNEADPQKDWEVINCGGVSYASYRLVPILKECFKYQPDLIILCTGHNEFLEDRTYGHIKHAPALVATGERFFGRLRLFTLIRQAIQKAKGKPSQPVPELSGETEPILDYHDSLKAYHRNPEWRAGVIAHYRANVQWMIGLSQAAGVPMLVVLPPSNLGNCPPFKSEHKAGISSEEQQQFEQLVSEARGLYRRDLSGAIRKLKAAIEIDDRYALTWFELGDCYRIKGLKKQAREAFVRAREEDICPLRILSPMEESLRQIVNNTGTPFVDAHALLEQESRQQILGGRWLVDHVHPTIPGSQKIAMALAEKLAEQGIAHLTPGWKLRAQSLCETHVEKLGTFYYLKGERTLEALRVWTQGQADGPSALERFPHLLRDQGSEGRDE